MKKLTAKEKKYYFKRMEEYYSEEEMQRLFNVAENFEKNNYSPEIGMQILSYMPIKDRHTCIALCAIYNYMNAYAQIDYMTTILTKVDFAEYKRNIHKQTLPNYFNGYTDFDFFVLKKSIEDDGKYYEAYLNFGEQELLCNIIDYFQGKREKIFEKSLKKIGTQNLEDIR